MCAMPLLYSLMCGDSCIMQGIYTKKDRAMATVQMVLKQHWKDNITSYYDYSLIVEQYPTTKVRMYYKFSEECRPQYIKTVAC